MNFLRSIFLYILFFVGAAAAMQEGFDVLNRVKSMGPKAGRSSEFAKLVGMKAEDAVKEIKKHRPELKVVTLPEGSMVTMDMDIHRVRIFTNPEGLVASPPRVG